MDHADGYRVFVISIKIQFAYAIKCDRFLSSGPLCLHICAATASIVLCCAVLCCDVDDDRINVVVVVVFGDDDGENGNWQVVKPVCQAHFAHINFWHLMRIYMALKAICIKIEFVAPTLTPNECRNNRL